MATHAILSWNDRLFCVELLLAWWLTRLCKAALPSRASFSRLRRYFSPVAPRVRPRPYYRRLLALKPISIVISSSLRLLAAVCLCTTVVSLSYRRKPWPWAVIDCLRDFRRTFVLFGDYGTGANVTYDSRLSSLLTSVPSRSSRDLETSESSFRASNRPNLCWSTGYP